jgi:hypothetical protein
VNHVVINDGVYVSSNDLPVQCFGRMGTYFETVNDGKHQIPLLFRHLISADLFRSNNLYYINACVKSIH